jgi:hypothetical protein
MRKLILSLALLVYVVNVSSAQNRNFNWAIGVNAGISEYSGDLGNGFLKFDLLPKRIYADNKLTLTNSKPVYLGISASKYYTNKVDFTLSASFGEHGIYNNVNSYFYSKFIYLDATARWKFMGNDNAKFSPYLLGGLGMRRVNLKDGNAYGKSSVMNAVIPVGLGLNIRCEERILLNIQSHYAWTNGDIVEGNPAYTKFSFDQFWNHSIGVSYLFGKPSKVTGTPAF